MIPKQQGTANTVVMTNEEELLLVQSEHDLITAGWIHTHPTQTCFMSSVDLHTHFGYQIMLREAIAIVMAPSKKKNSGIFSIHDSGLATLEKCSKTGFHQHGPELYGEASHAVVSPDIPRTRVVQLTSIK